MKFRFLVLVLALYTIATVTYSIPYVNDAKFNRLHGKVLREAFGTELVLAPERNVKISKDKAIEIAYWEFGRAAEIDDKSKEGAITKHINKDGRDSWIVSFRNGTMRTREGEQTGVVLSVFVDSNTGEAYEGLSYHPGNYSNLR